MLFLFWLVSSKSYNNFCDSFGILLVNYPAINTKTPNGVAVWCFGINWRRIIFEERLIIPNQEMASPFLDLKNLTGFSFNSRKCDNTFVNLYKKSVCAQTLFNNLPTSLYRQSQAVIHTFS